MQAIRELYKDGRGPSSSHTLAPERACRLFIDKCGIWPYYEAELFGSLSLTGKGHHTDRIIMETLPNDVKVIFSKDWEESFPNGMYLRAYDENKELQVKWTVFSIGGGSIEIREMPLTWNDEVYQERTFSEIRRVLNAKDITLLEYIYGYEPDLKEYLLEMLAHMIASCERGLRTEGMLPGSLHLERAAKKLHDAAGSSVNVRIMSYAYAASEENAAGNRVVTAPTLGACGVMAALMYYGMFDLHMDKGRLADALAIGGIFGNLIKTNATISGAVGGCQAEIGAAVSMASAAYAYMVGGSLSQIEYAAEIGMEHNLGLTCDPVMGYVMIPCIERNAMGIKRAIDSAELSMHMSLIRDHFVSFDIVTETMNETGKKIPIELKETAEGGLAKEFFREI